MSDLPNRLLYPDNYDRSQEIPMTNFDFIQSLQIKDMVVLTKQSHRGFNDLHLKDFYTSDPVVLDYRLQIVKDLVENPDLYDVFCKSITLIENIHDLRRAMNSDYSVESALGSVRYLETYQEIVDLFANGLKNLTLHSESLQRFREGILSIYEGEEYTNLRTELDKMEVRIGNLKSVTIGVNLNGNMCVQEAGLISLNDKPFHAGTIMEKLLKKNPLDTNSLISPLYPLSKGFHGEDLKALNLSVQSSIDAIYSKALRNFEPVIQKYFNINTNCFTTLLDDIRFLTAGVKFILSMKENGFPMCRPSIAPIVEKKMRINGCL